VSSNPELIEASGRSLRLWSLIFEATIWLGLFRVAVWTLPFRRVAALCRLVQTRPSEDPDMTPRTDVESPWVEDISTALRRAADRAPWKCSCLVRSLAGYAMLRRRHLRGVVYLGIARRTSGELVAHSWLGLGDLVLTGAGNHHVYSTIAIYRPASRIPR